MGLQNVHVEMQSFYTLKSILTLFWMLPHIWDPDPGNGSDLIQVSVFFQSRFHNPVFIQGITQCWYPESFRPKCIGGDVRGHFWYPPNFGMKQCWAGIINGTSHDYQGGSLKYITMVLKSLRTNSNIWPWFSKSLWTGQRTF